jgi:GNAT superfamily N-acetyltransferase
MKLTILPLTPARRADIEQLFGPRGACGGCWCMVWRLPRKKWEAGKKSGNRRLFLKLVDDDVKPGLIAYHEGKPVGWISVGPRSEFDYLARSRVLKPIDEKPVWSVTCLFTHKDYRGKGVSIALLKAAVDFVKEQGGRIVEGYPVIPYKDKMPPVFAWTGTLAAFKKAGYKEVARGSKARPIMRRVIR